MSKKDIILPILLLPPVEYFFGIVNAGKIILEIYETYPKQTYRNRFSIYSANGILNLSLAVHKPNGSPSKTKDILISYKENWQAKYWRAIETAYNSSPFFMYYKNEIQDQFMQDEPLLYHFNIKLIEKLCHILEIEWNYSFSNDYITDAEDFSDLRNSFNPKKKSDKQHYPEYKQVFSDKYGFKPNLSILDLLFNLGPEARLYLQKL